jgi:putative tricarboxylic transport membrane protein
MRAAKRVNGQAGFALALIVFAVVYASQIPDLGLPFRDGREPGAAFFPMILVVILVIGAVQILISELRGTGEGDMAASETSQTVPRIGLVGPLVLILMTGLFAFGLLKVGYFVAAGLYTFGVALFFNYEESGRIGRAAGAAVITAAAITGFGWLFFEALFDLSLPGWAV